MELRPLSDFIKQQKETITINDNQDYTRVTIKIHRKGIILRDKVKGNEIKTKKQQVCKYDQLLVAEIDAKVGGYGIIPKELEDAIVSSHYFLFDIDTNKLLVSYLLFQSRRVRQVWSDVGCSVRPAGECAQKFRRIFQN